MIKVYHAKNQLREELERLEEERKPPLVMPLACVLLTFFLTEHPELTMWIKDFAGIILEGVTGKHFVLLPKMVQASICFLPVFFAYRLICAVREPSRKEGVLEGGLIGETIALDLVKSGLQMDATVYTNLLVPNQDGTGSCEVDLTLVTASGLTVIEVKHYSGTVSGDADDYELKHANFHKKATFYNPIRQSRTHVHALKAYLLKNWIDVPVRRCVLFTHENFKLDLGDSQSILQYCPVFTMDDLDAFYSYLEGGSRILGASAVERTNRILQRLL